MKRRMPAVLVLAIAFGADETLFAQVAPADNIPNWSVPATWSPSADRGGIQTMTDVTSPRLFVGVAPCRVADTRTGQGFSGQAGPPIIPSNATRNFQISGSPATLPAPPNGCPANAIPDGADAVSFQFTVVSPTDGGNLIAWPAGDVQPQVSVLNWPTGTVALGNGTIVPLSAAGALSVRLNMAAGQSAHLVIDVNGYFSETLETPSNYLELNTNSALYTAYFTNSSTTCGGACGIVQTVASGGAIYGISTEANADLNIGVYGQVLSTGNGTAGVRGDAQGPIGHVFGGRFSTSSPGFGAAGVKGIGAYGDPLGDTLDCTTCSDAGVRGVDGPFGTGVLGLARGLAIAGILLDPTDVTGPFIDSDAEGFLGYRSGATVYAVFYNGGTGGTGIKSFIEPHATDPSKVIRYVSLEGPEAGTYFRGKGRFARGMATIDVPEDFRMVTDRDGLSIQVTPIGEMATVAVVSIGLDRIVVKASRNVEFFYTVNGVRATFKDHLPIKDGVEFMPRKAEATMPGYLSEGQKQLLIQNGTYKADGTVNLETAHRLGWDRAWDEVRIPSPSPEGSTGANNP